MANIVDSVAKRATLKSVLGLLIFASVAAAQQATLTVTTGPLATLPAYFNPYKMVLGLKPQDAATSWITLAPLTPGVGLNASNPNAFRTFNIQGGISILDQSNATAIDGRTLAYVSCDSPVADSYLGPSETLNTIMGIKPRGIVLFSLMGNACSLEGGPLPYDSIWTMTSSNDSHFAKDIISRGNVLSAVTANMTDPGTEGSAPGNNNSSIAMAILYSITGLIALLFLVIIMTGAVRAHRHPERYGPNAVYGTRLRQGRARGLARAVLETLPIVKFGDPHPTKSDPEQELENMSVLGERSQQQASGVSQAAAPTEASTASKSAVVPPKDVHAQPGATEGAAEATAAGRSSADPEVEEHLGCAICTEDFKVGEDMRVLPCNHRFHPACVDPWLVNVSGTCPLCRLDLRPPAAEVEPSQPEAAAEPEPSSSAAPTLEATNDASEMQRRRRSRLHDWNRLRHATVDERIQALRQYRQQEAARAADSTPEERSRRAKLADKLRERFHIRTRIQEAGSSQEASQRPEA